MPLIKILKRADIELTEASQWYEDQQKGLSINFREAIEDSLNSIVLNPLTFSKRLGNEFRFAIVHKFPYLIVYWYDEKLDTVYITSVFIQKEILLNSDRWIIWITTSPPS